MSRIIALDLGTTTLGVAITDRDQKLALALTTIRFESGDYRSARTELITLLAQEKIETIVLGKPLHLDGHPGERVKSVERFASDLLKSQPSLTIHFVDERLTTVEAKARMEMLGLAPSKQKALVDQFAAVVILENYLNRIKEQKNG